MLCAVMHLRLAGSLAILFVTSYFPALIEGAGLDGLSVCAAGGTSHLSIPMLTLSTGAMHQNLCLRIALRIVTRPLLSLQ